MYQQRLRAETKQIFSTHVSFGYVCDSVDAHSLEALICRRRFRVESNNGEEEVHIAFVSSFRKI